MNNLDAGMPPTTTNGPITYDPFINIPGYDPKALAAYSASQVASQPAQAAAPVSPNDAYEASLPPTSSIPDPTNKYDPFAGLDGVKGAIKPPGMVAWQKILGNSNTNITPTSDHGYLATLGAGLGKGFGDMMLGGQQLAGEGLKAIGLSTPGNWLVNDAQKGLQNLSSQYQPYQQSHPTTGFIGDITGETAPLLMSGPADVIEGAGNLGEKLSSKVFDAKSMLGKLLTRGTMGAAQGAAASALLPVNTTGPNSGFWGQKLDQLDQGATGGVAGAYLGSALGKIIYPTISAKASALMKEGITPTAGQILGGAANQLEQKATSIPFVGDAIAGARNRSVQDLNISVAKRALSPIGETLENAPGRDMVEEVQDKLGDAYDNLLSKMSFVPDEQFGNDMARIQAESQSLEPARATQFNRILDNKLYSKLSQNNTLDGQTLKGVQSELGRLGTGYLGDQSMDAREMGAKLLDVKNALEAGLTRSNPEQAQQLAKINEGYANYVRLRSAAGMQGANDGVFSANQLSNAVRKGDKSVQKGSYAAGNAFMQDLSDPARSVLGNTVPDSGTAGRGFLGGLMAYGAYMNPVAALHGAALSLPYLTPGTQKLFATALAKRPGFAPALANAVKNYGVTPLSLLNQADLANPNQ